MIICVDITISRYVVNNLLTWWQMRGLLIRQKNDRSYLIQVKHNSLVWNFGEVRTSSSIPVVIFIVKTRKVSLKMSLNNIFWQDRQTKNFFQILTGGLGWELHLKLNLESLKNVDFFDTLGNSHSLISFCFLVGFFLLNFDLDEWNFSRW